MYIARTRRTDVPGHGAADWLTAVRRCTPRRRRTFTAHTGVESKPLTDRLFFLRESAIVGTRIFLTRLPAIGRHPKWYVATFQRRCRVRGLLLSRSRGNEYFFLNDDVVYSAARPFHESENSSLFPLRACFLSSRLCTLDRVPGSNEAITPDCAIYRADRSRVRAASGVSGASWNKAPWGILAELKSLVHQAANTSPAEICFIAALATCHHGARYAKERARRRAMQRARCPLASFSLSPFFFSRFRFRGFLGVRRLLDDAPPIENLCTKYVSRIKVSWKNHAVDA